VAIFGLEWSFVMLWRDPVWPNCPKRRGKFRPFGYSLRGRDWLAGMERIEPCSTPFVRRILDIRISDRKSGRLVSSEPFPIVSSERYAMRKRSESLGLALELRSVLL
jgi:hypothetical protein